VDLIGSVLIVGEYSTRTRWVISFPRLQDLTHSLQEHIGT